MFYQIIIEKYINGIKNERFIDERLWKIYFNDDSKFIPYIPRPALLSKNIKKILEWQPLNYLIIIGYIILIGPIIHLFMFGKSLIVFGRRRYSFLEALRDKRLYIISGSEQINLFLKTDGSNIGLIVGDRIAENNNIFSLSEISKAGQKIIALFIAIYVHCILVKENNKKLILQSYSAYKWALAAILAKEIHQNPVIFSQIDRICMLLECISEVTNNNYEIMQHGSIESLTTGMPHKLRFVSIVNVIDAREKEYFSEWVIEKEASVKYKVMKTNPRDARKIVYLSNRKSLLIIGNKLFLELHKKIFEILMPILPDVEYHYRPEPGDKKYVEYLNNMNIIYDNSDEIKVASVVLCYPSTLLYTYEKLNTKLIRHENYCDDDGMKKICNIIHDNLIYQGVEKNRRGKKR